ncbi:MAG: hypothetical protein ACT4PQ_02310 [Betaproteobacteria bacterium]
MQIAGFPVGRFLSVLLRASPLGGQSRTLLYPTRLPYFARWLTPQGGIERNLSVKDSLLHGTLRRRSVSSAAQHANDDHVVIVSPATKGSSKTLIFHHLRILWRQSYQNVRFEAHVILDHL